MKTEKVGAVIYYKHLKILEEANLTDEQIGKILISAIKYDETGICPQFSSPLSAFFTMIKYDLDANREKWESIKEERSRVGRLGGRPPKKAKEPIGLYETKKTNWFSIDAVKLSSSCDLNPEWLQSPYSFLDFAAERVNESYGDKPISEQKALYIDAVKNWEELRAEYPEWKERKIRHEQEMAMNEEIKTAMNNHPTKCERCGGDLKSYNNEYKCNVCGAVCSFDTEKIKWTWRD